MLDSRVVLSNKILAWISFIVDKFCEKEVKYSSKTRS